MATTYLQVRGKCEWAQVYKPSQKYDNYSIVVYPDARGLKDLKASGISVRPKQNDEGETSYTFRRPNSKKVKDDIVEFGKPRVYLRNDEDEKGYVDFDKPIGNGSEVIAKIALYDTQKGKGHRLEAVLVLNHVPFVPREFNRESFDDNSEQPAADEFSHLA